MSAAIALSSVERSYDQGRQCFEHIVDFLDSGEVCSMTHSNLERELETRGRELMRILLQEHLDSRRPGLCEQPVCGADGIERPRVRLHDCKLESVFGTVVASRSGYGQEGVESLHPLDAEKRKQKMGKRLSKGEKKNAKRMATVATVYTTEPFRITTPVALFRPPLFPVCLPSATI